MKNLQPRDAWIWLQAYPDSLFVDVRMEIEPLYVGRPPGVVNLPWYEYPDLQPDAQKFAATVAREAGGKSQPVPLLICRSGKRGRVFRCAACGARLRRRTGRAVSALRAGALAGWRFDGLPWEQM
ncbi:rhodanese-like domain-containing protein [Polaromonas sp.]|uniref:rhodanese-like domain-containing protein n=1 Tax=Polaromonas sp. TaxID=1869339 RepID=UPI0026011C10|nr:rhodanese-like domain-containing protein [Polaromonas sp.]